MISFLITLLRWLRWPFLLVGLVLMSLNLFGLTQPLRYSGLEQTEDALMRFPGAESYTPEEVEQKLAELPQKQPSAGEDTVGFAEELNEFVNGALVHVRWNLVDPKSYNQLIPPWENYFLWAIGRFTDLPQFNRYHFSDHDRIFERGIGVCGDASIALDRLFNEYDLESNIIEFPGFDGSGHVIVEHIDNQGRSRLYDPDFGVDLGTGLDDLEQNVEAVADRYRQSGYSKEGEQAFFKKIYASPSTVWDDTEAFMQKRFWFERISYVLKWVLPGFLLLMGFASMRWRVPVAREVNQ